MRNAILASWNMDEAGVATTAVPCGPVASGSGVVVFHVQRRVLAHLEFRRTENAHEIRRVDHDDLGSRNGRAFEDRKAAGELVNPTKRTVRSRRHGKLQRLRGIEQEHQPTPGIDRSRMEPRAP